MIRTLIRPEMVYDREGARAALGLTKTTLARELRLGRLRCAKRAGRYFVLGEWLLDWLRAGEVQRSRESGTSASSSTSSSAQERSGSDRSAGT